jgi:alkyldihydroxyacetonephosphate synthase
MFFLKTIKGFDPDKMWACILLFEGRKETVEREQKNAYTLAKEFNGIEAGPDNGIRGYFLTYVIAYLRDFAFDHYIIAESFECSVPWDTMNALCKNVKKCLEDSCSKRGITENIFISCRVTQVYETGCCVYFYFGFNYLNRENAIETYEAIENEARDEILRCGGSLSHHHGVGKIRKSFMQEGVKGTWSVDL